MYVCLCVCMYVCMINPWHSLHSRSVLCTFLKLLNITICVSLHFTIFSCKPSIILPCIFLCLLCSDFPWIATLTLTGSLTYKYHCGWGISVLSLTMKLGRVFFHFHTVPRILTKHFLLYPELLHVFFFVIAHYVEVMLQGYYIRC